jgi:hypothetical protein
VRFDNWTMINVAQAIEITNYYLMEGERRTSEQPVSNKTPVFRNITLSHMTITGAKTVMTIEGLPESAIHGLQIFDVIGSGKTGMTAHYTDCLELHNVQLNPDSGPAFTAVHATNLELDHVTTRKPLPREPVVRLEDAPAAILRDSKAFPDTGVFLSVPVGELKSVILQGNVLGNAHTPTQESAAGK